MAESFTILSQRPTTAQDAGGNFVKVMEVRFKTATGVIADIEVPLTQYGPDRVRELVTEYAARIDTVQSL